MKMSRCRKAVDHGKGEVIDARQGQYYEPEAGRHAGSLERVKRSEMTMADKCRLMVMIGEGLIDAIESLAPRDESLSHPHG